MATTKDKKYLSLTRLTEYDVAIKGYVDAGDTATLASAKSYADGLASGKSDASHTHDSRYYTETEIDSKISAINTSIGNITGGTTVVKEAEHADSADEATHATSADTATTAGSATKATQDGNGKNIASTYETKTDASSKLSEAKSYTDTIAGGKADAVHDHDADYDEKGAAASALSSAQVYADNAAATVKNDLLNGAGTAYDTLKELGDLIDDNADAIDALETVAAGKADADHNHDDRYYTESEIDTKLSGKANSSHGTHVTWSTTAPKMDGTAAVGTETKVARGDHVHPTDTSRASQADLDALEAVVEGKANGTHSHTITATATDDDVIVLTGTNGSNKVTYDAKHATSGVTAGTYKSVTVNAYGHITAGTNPTTLAGYGITDAAAKNHTHTVDSALSGTSTNPVQNKVINSAVTTLTSAINTNTAAIEANTVAIAEFEEITSAEIQALFA